MKDLAGKGEGGGGYAQIKRKNLRRRALSVPEHTLLLELECVCQFCQNARTRTTYNHRSGLDCQGWHRIRTQRQDSSILDKLYFGENGVEGRAGKKAYPFLPTDGTARRCRQRVVRLATARH